MQSGAWPRHGLPQEESRRERPRPTGVTKAHLPGPRIARFVGVAPSFSPTLLLFPVWLVVFSLASVYRRFRGGRVTWAVIWL